MGGLSVTWGRKQGFQCHFFLIWSRVSCHGICHLGSVQFDLASCGALPEKASVHLDSWPRRRAPSLLWCRCMKFFCLTYYLASSKKAHWGACASHGFCIGISLGHLGRIMPNCGLRHLPPNICFILCFPVGPRPHTTLYLPTTLAGFSFRTSVHFLQIFICLYDA